MLPHRQSAVRQRSQPAIDEFITSYEQLVGCPWHGISCLGYSQSIPATAGKAVFKGRRRRIQAASGRFRARLEGCVQSRPKSLLCTQSKKQAAFEPIIHPRTRRTLRNGVSDTALYTLKREGD